MGGRMQRNVRVTAYQRGAVAIWVGVSIVALLTAAFLAIETGRLYYTQRDLQRMANLAAVAGVQFASGCAGPNSNGTLGGLTEVTSLVSNFIVSNGGDSTYLTSGINGYVPVELGTMVTQNDLRVFKPLVEGDPGITAIRVNLTRPQPTPFTGFLTGGNTLRVSATAEQPLTGSFTVGSTLLSLKGGLLNQVLGGLLCPAGDTVCQANVISLNVVSYSTGLANTSISLGQLSTAVGVSVKDLSDPLELSTKTIVLSDALNGLAGSLSGTVSSSVTGLLLNLAAASAGNRNEIPLGQVLGAVDDVAGAVPFINALDLIMALGAAAHAGEDGAVMPIELPIELSIPSVATVTAYLRILQPAQSSGVARPGFAKASTSQIRIEVRIKADQLLTELTRQLSIIINGAGNLLKLLGVTLVLDVSDSLNIGIDVSVAAATAYLDGVVCPSINNGMPIAQLSASTSLADVDIGTFSGTPTATYSPPLDRSTTGWDVLTLTVGLRPLGTIVETVHLGLTSLGVSDSGVRPLQDVTMFERLDAPAGVPLVYGALGSAAVQPVTPVAANPQTVGAPISITLNLGLSVIPSGSGTLGAIGATVAGLLTTAEQLIQPLLDLVNGLVASLVNPVLDALGIQTGTGTVTMYSVQVGRPTKTAVCIPGGAGSTGCQVPE
ncbi:MAG: hypothetical protein JWQ90_3444 [Hydrocarboniphaga sp.]|uniref:pilus assembly protein TadG-related protein n=1 Tax=Hydrocarboniphaga sp. TaxID=2033016 RepID=UPI0026252418|nr:pilus assembly protein TadG-related protein [Hydrocarboniphaga sp.]MDB5970994.1 hypothetical protein [Hydrocarboniphaga sp.]